MVVSNYLTLPGKLFNLLSINALEEIMSILVHLVMARFHTTHKHLFSFHSCLPTICWSIAEMLQNFHLVVVYAPHSCVRFKPPNQKWIQRLHQICLSAQEVCFVLAWLLLWGESFSPCLAGNTGRWCFFAPIA